MAAKVKIVMNPAGVRDVLKAPGVVADLERRGRAIAERAGEGVNIQTTYGRTRARVTVMTETIEAKVNEATNRSLTRAIDAGR